MYASIVLGKYHISYSPDLLHSNMSVLWRERIIMVDGMLQRAIAAKQREDGK